MEMEDVTRHVRTSLAHLHVPVVWDMFWQMMILTVLVRALRVTKVMMIGQARRQGCV